MTRARSALLSLALTGCGVPQEIFSARLRELDRCHADLTRSQGDLVATRKNADDLANQTSEMRDRMTSIETDRSRLTNTVSAHHQRFF